MLDNNLIIRKTTKITEYIDGLEPLATLSIPEIKSDYRNYHTCERLLQLIVDTMIDINTHLIKEIHLNVPDDLQSTFITLADRKILPMDFAIHLAPVVGTRNRLVHRYEDFEQDVFLQQLKRNFVDFKKYLTYIDEYLTLNEAR